MKMFDLGAIGTGHMGMAVLEQVAAQWDNVGILVYEIDAERRKKAKLKGFTAAGSESEVYANSQILLLAVPPQACEELLSKLAISAQRLDEKQEHKPVILSIMAGISANYIRGHLGADTAVITVMPTLGMRTGQGAAAIAHTDNVPDPVLSQIVKVFSQTGEAVIVEEPLLKEIVAVNGCMPGYVFYLLDAFAKGAKGVDYNTAARMAARGFIGAANEVLAGSDPKELLAEVCTPGGLTAQGVLSFEKNQIANLLAEGMDESIRRGYEIGK